MVISNNDFSTLQVVIPFGYGIIDAIGLLFSSTPLPFGFCEGVTEMLLETLCHHALVRVVLHRQHLKHQCRQCTSYQGWGNAG